ncbi:AAA family ATPase [uncultured Methanobrevibacter sp.]|uniref:AAA family ATPase n=1 Tax=uncultured Methanobrevibacter sp. TaxID=253161 RepID=UPI0025CDA17A|nr:AAA family ATPase [uncultured Methanobrevibacter sp.]
MKIIGISGMPGSGKSVISTKAEENGAIVVNMGDRVREEANKRNEDSRITAVKLREEQGEYVVAKLTINKIKEIIASTNDLSGKLIVVEGIRSPYEVKMFRENFNDFKILSVFSSPKIRFERLKLRKRMDDSNKYEIFEKRDQNELNFGVGTVIATSDYLIINESSMESYQTEVDNFLTKIMN